MWKGDSKQKSEWLKMGLWDSIDTMGCCKNNAENVYDGGNGDPWKNWEDEMREFSMQRRTKAVHKITSWVVWEEAADIDNEKYIALSPFQIKMKIEEIWVWNYCFLRPPTANCIFILDGSLELVRGTYEYFTSRQPTLQGGMKGNWADIEEFSNVTSFSPTFISLTFVSYFPFSNHLLFPTLSSSSPITTRYSSYLQSLSHIFPSFSPLSSHFFLHLSPFFPLSFALFLPTSLCFLPLFPFPSTIIITFFQVTKTQLRQGI